MWAGLLQVASGRWLRMEWDPEQAPYLGLWVDEGALNHESVATPEPTTGWYDNLAIAWEKKEVMVVPAGASHEWSLSVHFGVDGQVRPG